MPLDQPFNILVVDDESAIFELLSRIGRQQFPEATFISVLSPQETITYLDKQPAKRPQLVLLDIDFQQAVDGLTLLPQLQTRFKGQVPIIMFTTSNSELDVQQAYDTGAIAYTQKPDDLQGWKEYVSILKKYWYETTLLPPAAPPPVHLLQ